MGSAAIIALVVLACAGSFGLGRVARPRLRRRIADLELAHAHALIVALRRDIAELPAAIYSSDPRRAPSPTA